jgi:hypothetical protein
MSRPMTKPLRIAEEERPKSDADIFHEKRCAARKAITEVFSCATHSLPDKPALCWKDPGQNLCYPITESNLNFWATLNVRTESLCLFTILNHFLKVKDPEKYSAGTKPPEINLYNNGPRTRAPAQAVAQSGQGFPQPPPSMNFPYGYYPPPYMMPPSWYPQQPPPALNFVPPTPNLMPLTPNPAPPVQNQTTAFEYPNITTWLAYCDQHPNRCGENFSMHAGKFSDEGYRRIQQLTGDRISVEKLSSWLGIGKGTADLLIQYAEEDVALVKVGAFKMAMTNNSPFGK